MSNPFNELLNDLASSEFANNVAEYLEKPENVDKLQRLLNVVVLGLMARRRVRKGLVAAGLAPDKAKQIASALSWGAYLIASGATTGRDLAEDVYDNNNSEPDDEAT